MEIIEILKQEKEPFPIVHYPKGRIISLENERCTNVTLILSGKIKISSYSLENHEIIYNIIGKNEIFGNNLLFSSHPFYKGNVTAMEDSELLLIEKERLLFLLKNNDDFLNKYLEIHSDFAQKLNFRIKLLSISELQDRFLYYLEAHGNMITYTSTIQLAEELGVQRESLSRVINRLEKNKTILRNNKTIHRNDKNI